MEDSKKQNEELKSEIDDLRNKLIEMGNYKEGNPKGKHAIMFADGKIDKVKY